MDSQRFDDLTRSLARGAPSRRTLLRGLAGGLIGAAGLGGRRAAAQECKPACPPGSACLGGKCETVLEDEGCPVGCPSGFVCSGKRCVESPKECGPCEIYDAEVGCLSRCAQGESCVVGVCERLTADGCSPPCVPGFVCSGDRCVEEVRAECGPCEFFDAVSGCYLICDESEFCFYSVPEGFWECRDSHFSRECMECDGRLCRNLCAPGEGCIDGECVLCSSLCAGVTACGDSSTEGLCCHWPDKAVCLCESQPGAGDGFVGCCGAPGNPCPKRISEPDPGFFTLASSGCTDLSDLSCPDPPFTQTRVYPDVPGRCGGIGAVGEVACYHPFYRCSEGCGVCEICGQSGCVHWDYCDRDCRAIGCSAGGCVSCDPWFGECIAGCLPGERCVDDVCVPV